MKIKTRQEAIAAGEDTYYTGQPCKHGHRAPRSVRNKGCLECGRMRATAQADKERAWIKDRRRFDPRRNQDPASHDGAMNLFLYGA